MELLTVLHTIQQNNFIVEFFFMQPSLFDHPCPCGAGVIKKAGLCRRCYFAQWHSKQRFNGLREKVLSRDGHCCRVCGIPRPIVHHRRRHAPTEEHLITLCPAHHAQVERLRSNHYWMPELLFTLWREQHPGAAVQLQLDL